MNPSMRLASIKEVHTNGHFVEATESFHQLVDKLRQKSSGLQLSQAETLLKEEGRELLRQLMQGLLNAGGNGDVGVAVENSEGVVLLHKRERSAQIKTIFGAVTTVRQGYSNHEEVSVFPKDQALNLSEGAFSYGLRKEVVQEVVRGSFAATSESVLSHTGVKIHGRQIEEVTVDAAQDFEAFYERRAITKTKNVSTRKELPLQVITSDGKGIVMRKEDLREATRKKAEETSHHLQHRLSKGEKLNAKRMATVAAVYDIDRYQRTPQDFLHDLDRIKLADKQPRPRPVDKRVWASIERRAKDVIHEAFQEAIGRDPDKRQEWVCLVDGDQKQIKLLKKQARQAKREVTIVLDIIHVIEYLWKAARVFHEEKSKECEEWVTERLQNILEGNAGHTAAGIRRSATIQKFSKIKREPIETCAKYLLNHTQYMQYDQYLTKGYPIATGVIEGACRHLIKDRLDITGARWSLMGAEAVLRLRSIKSSGDFEKYWEFYESQEFGRNYGDNYFTAVDLN